MDNETILKLLKGNHIGMAERIEKGYWPHPPIFLSDLINIIVSYFDSNKWFPYAWIDRQKGELIDDVSVIEKISESKYIYRSRSASPVDLTKIGLNSEEIFSSAKDVAEYYLRNDLNLPGDLDGWTVVDDL